MRTRTLGIKQTKTYKYYVATVDSLIPVSRTAAFTCCECDCESADSNEVKGTGLIEMFCPSCGNTWEVHRVNAG